MFVIARRLWAGTSLLSCMLLLCAAPDPAAARATKKQLAQLKSEHGYCYQLQTTGYGSLFPGKVESLDPAAFRQMLLTTTDRVEIDGNTVRIISGAGTARWAYVPCGQHDAFFGPGSYGTPGVAGIELGVLFGHTGSNQDATLNTSFGTSNSGSIMDSANNVGFDARIRLPLIDGSFRVPQDWGARQISAQAQGPNVFAGYRFMSYYNEKGELVLNLHPTAGNDTFLRFRPDSSHTFYGGVGIPVFGPNVVPGIDQGMIDLYAGYRHVIGDITGSTNETGGGGGITPLGGKFNQNGWVFGGEFNVRTSALGIPVILGIGVDVAKLDGGSLSNNSVAPLAFNYNTVLPDRTETTVYGKVAVPLLHYWARFRGDRSLSALRD